MPSVRLFVEDDLATGAVLGLDRAQAHYVSHVMRLGAGDALFLFNGRDGEWRGTIEGAGRGWCSVAIGEQTKPFSAVADLWLLFAPVKRARIDFIASKATELGVSRLQPVFTEHTSVSRVNTERLRANAIEAAEQCGAVTVPDVADAKPLGAVLESWPEERGMLVCDETGGAPPVLDVMAAIKADGGQEKPWAVLIGPEGGFSPAELDRIRQTSNLTPVSLGPRILRADTAALAALTCWQAVLGDWVVEDQSG